MKQASLHAVSRLTGKALMVVGKFTEGKHNRMKPTAMQQGGQEGVRALAAGT
jgi:hypothetical protein